MAITLQRTQLAASVKLCGEAQAIIMPSGRTLKIETSPGGADVLDAMCPEGKMWSVAVSVNIDEVDV